MQRPLATLLGFTGVLLATSFLGAGGSTRGVTATDPADAARSNLLPSDRQGGCQTFINISQAPAPARSHAGRC